MLKDTKNTKNIITRVKSVEDALAIAGIKLEDLVSEKDTPDESAYKVIKIVIKVLNENWVPDWSNNSQWKYIPYFLNKPGFGLSYYDYVFWFTDTDVSSRLCFKTSNLAKYAGKTFIKLYEESYLIN